MNKVRMEVLSHRRCSARIATEEDAGGWARGGPAAFEGWNTADELRWI